MAYGPNVPARYWCAATDVDKILKGPRRADLPIKQPTKFDLVVNRKTAWALGLTVPPLILLSHGRRDRASANTWRPGPRPTPSFGLPQ
jgi:putative ABC transport system substrate-binding protein